MAGIDSVSDGELRRDNDIDYLLARVPGVEVHNAVKAFYLDYLIVKRIERALQVVPADRIVVTPHCGLRHVPADAARAKLRAMTTAAAAVRGRTPKEKKT